MWEDVRLILAHKRQGTHKVKERSEVSGSTRKLYRQKGTGNARVGDANSGTRRHGGTMHGPRPRTYGFKLNHKVKQLARRSALSVRAGESAIVVIDQFGVTKPQIKAVSLLLSNLKLTNENVLMLTGNLDKVLYKAAGNLQTVQVQDAASVNTYQILKADKVVLDTAAVEVLNKLLA
jgi:large subunit ribosomal protein L4